MSQIKHNFAAIDGALDEMQGTVTVMSGKREEMDQELTTWAGYWNGVAHEQATVFSRRVTSTLDNVIMASNNYINKARVANQEMQAQEMAAAGMWG